MAKQRAGEIRAKEVRPVQRRVHEVGPVEIGVGQVRANQHGADEARITKLRSGQVGEIQADLVQFSASLRQVKCVLQDAPPPSGDFSPS